MKRFFKNTVQKHLFDSAAMTIGAILTVLLLSNSVRNVGMTLIILAVFLFAVNIILFKLLEPVKLKALRTSLTVTVVLISLISALSAAVFAMADNMMFSPNHDEESYLGNLNVDFYEEVNISTDDGTLSGWFCKNAEGKAPLVIYFGGNGESSARRFNTNFEENVWDTFAGYNFLMVDYPEYGRSGGKLNEDAMYRMVLNTYDYAVSRDDVDSGSIVAMGYSLGTGMAVYLSAETDVSGLILMAPYNNGAGLYNSQLDIFYGPIKWLVKYHFPSDEYAEKVKVKPLILATKDDEMISFRYSDELSKHFNQGVCFKTFNGFNHNKFWGVKAVREDISEYLQEVINEEVD